MERYIASDSADFQYGVVNVDLEFTAGSSGAVPTKLTRSAGVLSVTKSTDDYVVVLEDGYVAFLGGFGNVVQDDFDATKAFGVKYSAFTNANGSNLAQVTLSPHAADGTAQPLVADDILHFTFRLSRLPQPSGQ